MLLKMQADLHDQAMRVSSEENAKLQRQLTDAIKSADNMAKMVELKGESHEIGKELFVR